MNSDVADDSPPKAEVNSDVVDDSPPKELVDHFSTWNKIELIKLREMIALALEEEEGSKFEDRLQVIISAVSFGFMPNHMYNDIMHFRIKVKNHHHHHLPLPRCQ